MFDKNGTLYLQYYFISWRSITKFQQLHVIYFTMRYCCVHVCFVHGRFVCDVVSTLFSNHMLICPFHNWPILFSPWINCLSMSVDWFCDIWSQITFAKSKGQGKFWKILIILVEIWTPDHIIGKQALYQLCYACLVNLSKHFASWQWNLLRMP